MEALKRVEDPEIHQDIVGLGLVYGVIIDDGGKKVTVKMTLTTPYCPYAPQLVEQARMAAGSVPGVEAVEVDMVWDPPWDPRTMASEEVKDILGLW